MGGDGGDTLLFDSDLSVTSDKGVIALGAGADSLSFAAITGGSIFGGASFGDTAAGNDTLEFTSTASATKIDLGSGTNFLNAEGTVNGSSVYGGGDKDTFLFSGDFDVSGVNTNGRIGSRGGNDSLSFTSVASSGAVIINAGDGADTIYFGNAVSATSILGGAGNDYVEFASTTSSVATQGAVLGTDNDYYYQSGTDTIAFSTQQTNTAVDVLTFYTESGAFSSTVTQTADASNNRVQIASGTDILAYVTGFTDTDKVVISTATSAAYTDLTSIG